MSTEFFYNDVDLSGNTLSNSTLKNISMEKVNELPTVVSEDGRVVVHDDQLYQYKKQTTVEIADLKPVDDSSYAPNSFEMGINGHGTVAVLDGVPTVYNLVPNGEDYPTNITFETALQTNNSNDFELDPVAPGTWMIMTDGRLYYQPDGGTTIIYNPAWEVGGEWTPISADQDVIADLETKIDNVSLGLKNKASARYRSHSTGTTVPSVSKTEMLEILHANSDGGKPFKTILQENGHDLMSYLGEHSTASRSFDKSEENTLMFKSLEKRVIGIEDLEILSKPSGVCFRGMVLNSREDYLLFKRLVTGINMNFKTGGSDMSFDVNDVFLGGEVSVYSNATGLIPVFTSNSTLQFDSFENKQVTLSFTLKTEATGDEIAKINSYIQDDHYASADVEWIVLNEKMTEDVDIKDQRILFSDGVYTVIETDPTPGSYKLERSEDMAAGTDATGLFVFVEQGLPDISEDMGFLQTKDDVTIAGTAQVTFERFTGVSTQTKKTVRELKQYVSEAMGAAELTSYAIPFSSQFTTPEQYDMYLGQSVKAALLEHQDGAPYVPMFATPQVMGEASDFPDSELETLWGGSKGDVYRSKKNPAMMFSPMFGLDAIPVGQSWNDLSNLHKIFFYVFNLVLQEVKPMESYPIKFAIYSLDENGDLVRNPDMERYAKVETGYNGFTAGKLAEVKELFEQVVADPSTTWRDRTFPSTDFASNWIQVLQSYEAMLKIYESRLYTLHIPVKSKRVSLDKYVVAVDEVLIDPMYASPYLKNLDESSLYTNFVPEAFKSLEQFISPTTALSIGDQEKLILNRSVYGIPSNSNDPATKFFFGEQ